MNELSKHTSYGKIHLFYNDSAFLLILCNINIKIFAFTYMIS
jgi:hypothetical protein